MTGKIDDVSLPFLYGCLLPCGVGKFCEILVHLFAGKCLKDADDFMEIFKFVENKLKFGWGLLF